MDLNQFETRDKAEEGISFPLVIDGETIMGDDGKPITFHVRGVNAPDVQTLVLKSRKAEANTSEEIYIQDMKIARATVRGWSGNFTVGGEKVAYGSPKALEKVLGAPIVRGAVLAKVFDVFAFTNGSSDGPLSTSDSERG